MFPEPKAVSLSSLMANPTVPLHTKCSFDLQLGGEVRVTHPTLVTVVATLQSPMLSGVPATKAFIHKLYNFQVSNFFPLESSGRIGKSSNNSPLYV